MSKMDYRLDMIALVASQHYRLLKTIVTSSPKFRLLTDEEAKLADYLGDVLERVGGKSIADYCRERFQAGWMSRDLRSYKIKFVLTHLRNILKDGRPVKNELIERLNDLTDKAESLAGCTPDSKRRNKKAVEERKRLKEEKKTGEHQMDLFEYAESQSSPENKEPENLEDLEDIELEVRLAHPVKKESVKTEAVSPERRKEKKKSAKERKFEQLTKDILQSEYGEDEESVQEEPDYEYGKTFGDTASVYGCNDGDNW